MPSPSVNVIWFSFTQKHKRTFWFYSILFCNINSNKHHAIHFKILRASFKNFPYINVNCKVINENENKNSLKGFVPTFHTISNFLCLNDIDLIAVWKFNEISTETWIFIRSFFNFLQIPLKFTLHNLISNWLIYSRNTFLKIPRV